ncbi:MAG TPA: VWA domain-containing protein [Thermoanaerobaculaceae bacterium]|nr:VWA domain-containing protein [Thermoanaerobaculaceae bacterium]
MKTGPTLRIISALLLLAVVVFAQEEPPSDKPPAEKPPEGQVGGLHFLDVSEVTIVNVEVTVTDKHGPVLGLKTDDFEVLQDGKLQPLTNFALYTRKSAPAPVPVSSPLPADTSATPTPAPAETPKREPRFIAFYVDNEFIAPMNRNRVIGRMADWVYDNLKAPDQAMVVSYQRSLKVLQPFTSEADDVAAALRAVRKYTGAATDANSSRQEVEDYIEQNSKNASTFTQALDRVKSFAREQYNNLSFSVGALRELIGMMSGLPGKKAIIYLSDGLPMTPGLELYYQVQDSYSNVSVLGESRDNDATSMFQSLVTTATSAGVTLYTIDSSGLQSNMGIEAERSQPRSPITSTMMTSNYQQSLSFMAEQTGGIAILNANDPTPGLEKIADDFETFYSLGYRLIPSGQDRMHRIQVKVKAHPEYRLSYRKTFIEKTLPTLVGDRVVSGLAFNLEDNPLGVELSAGEVAPADNGRWTLPVEVRVPFEKIALIPQGDKLVGYIMVYYAARDEEGKQSDLQHTEHPISVPASEYAKIKKDFLTVSTGLLLEPGIYRISVGVRDELTNQAGYAVARKVVRPEEK